MNNLSHVQEELVLVSLYGPALTAPDRSDLDELEERLVALAVEDELAEIEEDDWQEEDKAVVDPRTAEIGEVFRADMNRGTDSLPSHGGIPVEYADHLTHIREPWLMQELVECGEVHDISNPRIDAGRGPRGGLRIRQRKQQTITPRRPN